MNDHHELEGAGLVNASGRGAELFDAPSVFYLTYREHIERWHGLGRPAGDAIDRWLDALSADFDDRAVSAGLLMRPGNTGAGYSHFLLFPPDTPATESGVPLIASCLGWKRGQAIPTGKRYAPFVGVRVDRTVPSVREAFLACDDGHPRRLRAELGMQRDAEWPVWHYVLGENAWWSDLDAYRTELLHAFDRVLEKFGDAVAKTARAATAVHTDPSYPDGL